MLKQQTIAPALTAAVLVTSINHFLFVGICRAGLVGAIVNAISEVHITAQTDHISATAAQLFCLPQQVIDAVLLFHVRSVTQPIRSMGGITYTTLWKALEQLGVLSDTDTDKECGS